MHHLKTRLWSAPWDPNHTIRASGSSASKRNSVVTNSADKSASVGSTTNAKREEIRTTDAHLAESIRATTWECNDMFYQLKTSLVLWAYQVKHYLGNEVIDLNPQEYCIFATFSICIGFVLLSGRR